MRFHLKFIWQVGIGEVDLGKVARSRRPYLASGGGSIEGGDAGGD